jgi:hypothetical protein
MKTADFDPKQIVRNLTEWMEKPQNYDLLVRQELEAIEQHLIKPEPPLSLCLQRIATWEGVCGERQLLEGNVEGWKAIQRSYLFLTWSRRIRLAFLDAKRGQKFAYRSEFALLLAHAIVIRDDAYADFLGGRLVGALVSGDKRITGWDLTPFEPFMVRLYAHWRGSTVASAKTTTAESEIYNALFRHWRNGDDFSRALMDACDYHLNRIAPTSGNDLPEFEHVPYCWFPVEILALRRIRQEEGRETPLPDHPLMKTELAKVPESLPAVHDELLDKVIAKVRSELPIGDPW